MCGIVGYSGKSNLEYKVRSMVDVITHRGPDDEGLFTDETNALALSFRRLAIQDLSPAGHQPMTSLSGRYTVIFNGEIYNFEDLRKDLEQDYKGHSDTEVILTALDAWGLERTLARISGMFAIALYDRKEDLLHLVRDHMGKKPLYYGHGKDGFYFASEMKSILAALPEKPCLNRDVAALYFQWRYVPDPHCIFEGFHKLSPGHILTLPLDKPEKLEIKPFWSLRDIAAKDPTFEGSKEDALNRLEEILSAATARRMIADVPLGAFLSGGIDSALIVAMMQQSKKTQTFTIAFEDKKYNEAEHARAIAAHLGTDHTEMMLTAKEALETVPALPAMFDEPFGDPSAIPTYHVCRLAKHKMTVALSGDGGDESFGGYSWYKRAAKINALPLSHLAGCVLGALPLSPQVRKMASVMAARDDKTQYRALHSYWQIASLLNYEPKFLSTPLDNMQGGLMGYDSVMFLPGDVLTKVDRVSMANSLEVRAPLLDREVVEFAWSLPPEMRVGKSLLKELLYRHVPRELIDRPKQGFSIPHQAWLRGSLREWVESILEQPHDLLDMPTVRKIWHAHVSGKADYGHLLWTITQFQSWYAHMYGNNVQEARDAA